MRSVRRVDSSTTKTIITTSEPTKATPHLRAPHRATVDPRAAEEADPDPPPGSPVRSQGRLPLSAGEAPCTESTRATTWRQSAAVALAATTAPVDAAAATAEEKVARRDGRTRAHLSAVDAREVARRAVARPHRRQPGNSQRSPETWCLWTISRRTASEVRFHQTTPLAKLTAR